MLAGAEVEDKVFEMMKERIPLAASQESSSEKYVSLSMCVIKTICIYEPTHARYRYPGIDPRPAVFGVVRRIEGTHDTAHTDQQMYSCGSLAPKMKRGGCMDSHFHKPAELWEKSEG